MTIIDTPAEQIAWKRRMRRVGAAHNLHEPDGFDPDVAGVGEPARDYADLLADHARGYHGADVNSDHTINGPLQAWLWMNDPERQLSNPVPGGRIIGPVHATEGLAGYPAIDLGAPAGTLVHAPEAGVVERWSGHDPADGPIEGEHGPFAWSLYLRGASGADYYMTHLASRAVVPGGRVARGQSLATIADYSRWTGTPDHVHIGVNPPADGHPGIAELAAAAA